MTYTINIQCDSHGKTKIEMPTLDFKALSDTYCEIRDESDEGASTFYNGIVYDPQGIRSHIISYNGKVWDVRSWPGLKDARAMDKTTDPVYDPYD